ncbi:Adenosylcobinamide-phosphate synthase [hydrothermal vent metagenome]|uniref:Adenosylcobinamide-phosphate synthase n=1 Tax=hydrothermal vent metagenome TaxID=652676 RepID=A0A1W1CTG0_9ZZZZ
MYFDIALIAYIIDRVFGEFRYIRHPVVLMGDYIKWFERRFYRQSIARGTLLALSLTSITLIASFTLQSLFTFHSSLFTLLLQGAAASTTIASKMLHDSVKEIITHQKKIKYLVSRDTQNLSNSDISKAAIETYAENLSDGVIAPLFYLILFGLPGAFVYKAINTLDSMVGYRNERYEKYGKFSARLDDVANYIPARITAVLIIVLFAVRPSLFSTVFRQGKQHESPNAGYPISAMALTLGIRLGGDTSYFGKVKAKPCLGEGRKEITTDDIGQALSFQKYFDIFVLLFLGAVIWAS